MLRMSLLKKALAGILAVLVIGYIGIAIRVATYDNTTTPRPDTLGSLQTIAIFGASGTAGDGILKASLASPHVGKIHVFTRRETPRIAKGVASGKVEMTIHMDYLDYGAIHEKLVDMDAVFWAIGLSSIGMEEDAYRRIHVDFPVQFLTEWLSVSSNETASFHYISSSDISEDASAMWARVKVEAENALFDLAEGTAIQVIAYRPDYIGPTVEEAHLGQRLLYGFFAPLGVAVKATQIGQSMLEVTLRADEFENGDKLSTWRIKSFSDAYETQ